MHLLLIPGGLSILAWNSTRSVTRGCRSLRARLLWFPAYLATWALVAGGLSVGATLIGYAAALISTANPIAIMMGLLGLFLIVITSIFLFTIRHWLRP